MRTILSSLHRGSKIILLFLLFAGLSFPAQGNTTIEKNVLELTYSSRTAIVKFRPVDFTLPGETYRVDLLVGRKFSSLTGYIYLKGDNHHGRWLGARLDAPVPFASPALKANLQLRYFQGMNPSSVNHCYVIPSVYYSIGGKHPVQVGFFGLGKKNLRGSATFYAGPAIVIPITSAIRIRLSYGKNVLDKGALLYLKLNIDIH